MAKLFPPYIEGTLPAFYQNENGTATITVPFVMNRGVSFSQISGFSLKIKSIQSSTYLYSTTSTTYNKNNIYFNLPKPIGEKEEAECNSKINAANAILTDIYMQEELITNIINLINSYRKKEEENSEETENNNNEELENIMINIKIYLSQLIEKIDDKSINTEEITKNDFNNIEVFLTNYLSNLNDKKQEQSNIVIENNNILNTFTTATLKPGLYYKIQLAYLNVDGEIGQYSTVGIIKYTTKPNVTIQNMTVGVINTTWHDFVGNYQQDPVKGDLTERIYSYRFDFYDSNNNLINSSGTLLHNSTTDSTNYSSTDQYYFSQALGLDQIYYVQYIATTQNGLVVASPKYAVMEKFSVESSLHADLNVTLNFENGYIDVWLKGQVDNDTNTEQRASGHFILTRSEKNIDTNSFIIWEKIFDFQLMDEKPSQRLWRDYTIEQGKIYKYSIQQYNENGVYSARKESQEIFADFEDMFLSDGIRQLKIRFNPKVSSFKNNVLETKIDTIGSKYPFIFRNGHVYYKEFPISGLISRLMDNEELFTDWDNDENFYRQNTAVKLIDQNENSFYGFYDQNTLIDGQQQTSPAIIKRDNDTFNLKTNLTLDNIQAERIFKLKVLDWLNNGEPKIFRSPTEGNYIVRLLNVSLTPNDTVGRMLHTFQCTAYEVDDFKYDNLSSLNFLQSNRVEQPPLLWKTKKFYTTSINKNNQEEINYLSGNILDTPAVSFQIEDCQSGDYFKVITDDSPDGVNITIGSTGQYIMSYPSTISQLIIPSDVQSHGQITYSYYDVPKSDFDTLEEVNIIDVPCYQYINTSNSVVDLFEQLQMVSWEYEQGKYKKYKNPKININKIYYIKIYGDKFLANTSINNNFSSGVVVNMTNEEFNNLSDNDKAENFIKITDERPYFLPIHNLKENELTHLLIYPNTIVEIGYQYAEKVFSGETSLDSYKNYTLLKDNYQNILININNNLDEKIEELETLRKEIIKQYNEYILDVIRLLYDQKEEED